MDDPVVKKVAVPPENAGDWVLGWSQAATANIGLLRPRSATGEWKLYHTGEEVPEDTICIVQGQRFVGIGADGYMSFVPDGPVFVWVEPEG